MTWNEIADKCDVHKCEEACSHVTTADHQSIFWLPAFFNNNNNKMNTWPKRQVYLRTSTKALQAFLLLYPGLKRAKEDNASYRLDASYRLVNLNFKKIRLADGPDDYNLTGCKKSHVFCVLGTNTPRKVMCDKSPLHPSRARLYKYKPFSPPKKNDALNRIFKYRACTGHS